MGNIRDAEGNQVVHNIPGTPYDANMPFLEGYVVQNMKSSPVNLTKTEADALIAQYQETADIRDWFLHAAAVMCDHTHVVVGVPGDPDPKVILETLKSWATRAVKKQRPLPDNVTFWTEKGSKRKLPNDEAIRAAVIYVIKQQPNPLAVWYAHEWQQALDDYDRASRAP